ncbi:hypothetical protein [Flavobacterium marginilacus]|uniref:hypothetical protein n=1 Tax=Flavobacterium marginilacus TaxID=3003256 RepID=UPI00248DF670|nr:hypothetical protein [Flavobacterium marginilacus]
MKKRTILNTKNIFIISIIVIISTVLSVWIYGLGKHQTVIENSFISASILSITFFLFITFGLYKGVKLKDNLGKITDQFDLKKIEHLKEINFSESADLPDLNEGIAGIILGIILWIIATLVFGYLFFIFGAIIWISILTFMAMLYWVFFRALRLIFKNANECNGNLRRSLLYGISYTILYNFWIYGIILIVNK